MKVVIAVLNNTETKKNYYNCIGQATLPTTIIAHPCVYKTTKNKKTKCVYEQ